MRDGVDVGGFQAFGSWVNVVGVAATGASSNVTANVELPVRAWSARNTSDAEVRTASFRSWYVARTCTGLASASARRSKARSSWVMATWATAPVGSPMASPGCQGGAASAQAAIGQPQAAPVASTASSPAQRSPRTARVRIDVAVTGHRRANLRYACRPGGSKDGHGDPDRLRLRQPGPAGSVLGGGPRLPGAGAAPRLRLVGQLSGSAGGAPRPVGLGQRHRRPGAHHAPHSLP